MQGGISVKWKEEAKAKLRRYDAMCQAVKNLPEEILRLKRQIRYYDGENPDEHLNDVIQLEKMEAYLIQAEGLTRSIDRAMGCLTPEEKLILYRLCICRQKGNLDRVCSELNIEQSSIYRKCNNALRKFTAAFYGVEERQTCKKSRKRKKKQGFLWDCETLP